MNKPAAIAEQREEPARFTVDEYIAMIEAGAFAECVGKIELVEGVIVRMSPPMQPHFWLQRQLFLSLHALFGDGLDGWVVGQEPTVRTGQSSVRNPDVAILRMPGRIERTIFQATDVQLAAEISDTTLSTDRGSKQAGYAEAAIPHYWIVDVNGRRLIAMSKPENGKYTVEEEIAFGEPMAVPGTSSTITLTYEI